MFRSTSDLYSGIEGKIIFLAHQFINRDGERLLLDDVVRRGKQIEMEGHAAAHEQDSGGWSVCQGLFT